MSNNEATDLVNSKNIVLFGNNPANTRMSGSAMQYLLTQVRLQNPEATIVVVDSRTCRIPPWAWPTAGSPSAPVPTWRSWPA